MTEPNGIGCKHGKIEECLECEIHVLRIMNNEYQRRVEQQAQEIDKWEKEARLQYSLFNNEIDVNRVLRAEIERLRKQPNIHWAYKGATEGYHIYLNDEQVHFTKDTYERNMFIAELKAKLKLEEIK
jgi:hypothetical protein